MSHYATTVSLDGEEHDDGCPGGNPGRRTRGGRQVNPTCRCGYGAPIAYRGSHVLPADDDDRVGYLSLSHIPSWVRDGGRVIPDDGRVWPWMRLTVADDLDEGKSVVLDVRQVERIHAAMGEWMARVDRRAP